MTDFKNIQIAVHGEWDGSLKTLYHYPSGGQIPEWVGKLPDPASVVRCFLNARDCYLIQQAPDGITFSLVTRNPLDARAGYLMVALHLADGYALTGRQTVNLLSSLRKTLLEDGDRNDGAVSRCLEASGIPADGGMKLASWLHKDSKASGVPVKPMAYRTYVSGQDLDTILSFPRQSEYTRFNDIVVISATASLRPGTAIERITQSLVKTYTVIAPAGVTTSAEVVSEGERLTITYTKPGFSPCKETVSVGALSPYVRYEGPAIRIRSAAESGLGFVRRIKLTVSSAKGGSVGGYTVNVNGRPANTMEPYIELGEHELSSGNPVEIAVASTNYRPIKIQKNASEIASMEEINLVLQPMEQGITLRLDFGDGRIFEQLISIEKNTPEYSQLHSGTFHGFRAHRVTVQGSDSEVYNVDVRSGLKPTAPSFANVAQQQTSSQGPRRVPVFENVSARHKEQSGGSRPVEITNATSPGIRENDKDSERSARRSPNIKAGYILGAVLSVVLLVLAFVFILPGGGSESSDNTDAAAEQEATAFTADPSELSAQQKAPTTAAAPAQPAPAPADAAAAETADIAYLNDNKVWELSKMQSTKYKALIDAISKGDIQTLAANEYFTTAGRSTNRYANDIVTWAWQAKGTHQETKNVDVLRASVKDGRVNIYELWENISRYKPSTPNPEPRPTK